MNNYLESVKEFHERFESPVLEKPTIPVKRIELRLELLKEELKELEKAIKERDLVEVADAFADLQYVLSGAILEFGFGNIFDKLFNEVHRSNMSKACETLEVASATQDKYRKDLVASHIKLCNDGSYLVFRTSDKKTLKSINYSPADLWPIILEEL